MPWLDICCGGGGTTLGLQYAGEEVHRGIEINPDIAKYYQKNTGVKALVGDLKVIDYRGFRGFNLTASFPCQTYSQANNKSQKFEDTLEAKEAIRILNEINPPKVIFENVPNWGKTKGFKAIIKWLEEKDYYVRVPSFSKFAAPAVNFKKFGVPQNRIRVLILASKNYFSNPKPKDDFQSWRDVINKHPEYLEETKLTTKQFARIKNKLQESLHLKDKEIKSFISENSLLYNQNSQACLKFTDAFPTLLANSTQQFKYLNKGAVYNLSPDMYKIIQTFPQDYKCEEPTLLKRILGNSIPPLGILPFITNLVID